MGFRGEEFAFDSPAAAIAAMSAGARRAGVESCALGDARGRVLRADVVADRDSPPFDYSAMDGFAVRMADLARGAGVLPVIGEARIGERPPELPRGGMPGVVRIATGAAIPVGADAVVRREDVREHPGGLHIEVAAAAAASLKAGESIRRRGENSRAGAVVVGAGSVLTAATVGTLAAVGAVNPSVSKRVRVAIISTGDELVAPADQPSEWQIRNSNLPALASLLSARAWIEVVQATHVRDDEVRLLEHVRAAIEACDAVVLSGGVSMGHRDPVRGAVEGVGARVLFHGLPQRPGKPMLGALTSEGKPVFGLPGNPISSMVTCARIAVPVLAACAGLLRWPTPPVVRVVDDDGQAGPLWWHRLVRLNERGEAELAEIRGSGDLIAAGRSDGFVEVRPRHGGAAGRGEDGEGRYPFYAWPG